MILFPAVDLKDGKAVRLFRGRADAVTVFDDDPLEAARRWERAGASWLHLVDLDGAFDGVSPHREVVAAIRRELRLRVQLGGGIRSAEAAASWLEAGIDRLIIGTMALERPADFAALCRAWPGRIGVSLDAENGRLKSRGWLEDTALAVDDVLPDLARSGAAFLIYTDIERDGMRSGVNLPALTRLAASSPLPLIAAGGVASLEDIRALYPLSRGGRLEGVISGRAIYEGSLDFAAALAWIEGEDRKGGLPPCNAQTKTLA